MPNRFAPRVLRNLISSVVCAVLTLGAFAPAKAGAFARSEYPGHAGVHLRIHSQALAAAQWSTQVAAQHLPEVGIGH